MVAGIALIAAALVGVAWGSVGSTERPVSLATAGGPSGPPTRADADPAGSSWIEPDQRRWLQILAALDGVRAQAYERGDTRLLTRVYLPGGHLQADSAQLAALVSAGDTARGVRHRMTRLDVLAASKDRVRLRVTQSLRQSQQVHGGHVVGVIPGSTETAVLVDLVATAAGWRLA